LGIREAIVLLIATFMNHIVKENIIKNICERDLDQNKND